MLSPARRRRRKKTAPGREPLSTAKIEMIRRDPSMTEAEKAAAIAELQARR
jgi:hypothetical protein